MPEQLQRKQKEKTVKEKREHSGEREEQMRNESVMSNGTFQPIWKLIKF